MLCKHSRPSWKMWGTAVWTQAVLNGSFTEDGPLLPVAFFCAVCVYLFYPCMMKSKHECLSRFWSISKSETHLCWVIIFISVGHRAAAVLFTLDRVFNIWRIWSLKESLRPNLKMCNLSKRRRWGVDKTTEALEIYSYPSSILILRMFTLRFCFCFCFVFFMLTYSQCSLFVGK